MESISREIAVLNTLDHPNIVKYYECFDDVDYIYLVMEYVNGAPLLSKVSKDPQNWLSEYKLMRYMRSLFEAVVHCHTFNVIHRDIKPANIMVNENDTIKLIDFGLAT